MIWTGILLLICHDIVTIGAENYLTWTKDVHHSANTVYDSDGNFKSHAELNSPRWPRAYSYTAQASHNKAPVYAWSQLGRATPNPYSQNQERNAWLRNWRYNNNQNKRLQERNAWNQAVSKYQDARYQQQLNSRTSQQLNRKDNQKQLYYWNDLARKANENRGYGLNYAKQWNQYSVRPQQRQGYRNPSYTYSQANLGRPVFGNQNRLGPYRPPKFWKDYRQGYSTSGRAPTWLKYSQGRLGYPSYPVNEVTYKNPSYAYQQNLYRSPAYSPNALKLQQLNRGAWKNRVPYSLAKRQGKKNANPLDQQYVDVDTDDLLSVNGALRQNNRDK